MSEKTEDEVLKDLPIEWIDLLNQRPELKEVWAKDIKGQAESIPEYFLTGYWADDYFEKYADYEPFFSCIDRGKEVFDLFYEFCGGNDRTEEEEREAIEKAKENSKTKLSDEEIKEIVGRYIDGINFFLKLNEDNKYELGIEGTYDINQMEIKRLSWEELEEQYDDLHSIDAGELKEYIFEAMDDMVLPDWEENILLELNEPLYQYFENYNNVYYVLWPLGKRDDIENPFKPYLELWGKNMEPFIINKNLIVVVGGK